MDTFQLFQLLGNLGELFGAIAVVLTLLYLVKQIRYGTEAGHISAYHQAQEQLWSLSAAISNDSELATIYVNAQEKGIDTLESADKVRLLFHLNSWFFGMESMLSLYEQGHIHEELWQNLIENNQSLLRSAACREILSRRTGSISQRLDHLVQEL